jgi:hypothetical protein
MAGYATECVVAIRGRNESGGLEMNCSSDRTLAGMSMGNAKAFVETQLSSLTRLILVSDALSTFSTMGQQWSWD